MTKDADSHTDKLLPGTTIKVVLTNANNQKVDSLQLTTNEFGSCHGTFLLPEHQLNGQFTIGDDKGWEPCVSRGRIQAAEILCRL